MYPFVWSGHLWLRPGPRNRVFTGWDACFAFWTSDCNTWIKAPPGPMDLIPRLLFINLTAVDNGTRLLGLPKIFLPQRGRPKRRILWQDIKRANDRTLDFDSYGRVLHVFLIFPSRSFEPSRILGGSIQALHHWWRINGMVVSVECKYRSISCIPMIQIPAFQIPS